MNIQRQASRPNQSVSDAPPAARLQQLVGQQGGEDTEGDGELLERAQPAAHGGRGDLGDVRGRDDRGDADADAREDAPQDQVPDAEREAGQDRGDEEQDRAEEHHAGAAEPVGQLAAQPRAERAAEQGDRDDEAR